MTGISEKRVVLLGAPGAGKGTQSRKLAEAYHVAHIATGDMFRSAVAADTAMGRAAKKFMDRGELVPDNVTIGVVEDRLAQPDAAAGFIMDGFPRTAAQATALDALLAKMGRRLDAVVEISVPRETLIARLTGRRICANCQTSYHLLTAPPAKPAVCDACGGALVQRADDAEPTVVKRLAVYERQTAPLIAYYKGAGLLTSVDGTQSVDAVFRAIERAMSPHGVRSAS
ncbi:MAG TPA: adenylate kinase [Candidatus Eremiobacteraceae bacterium]|nr:adenylate kinase [Candidatus Eremiobacteraceae bacterium]